MQDELLLKYFNNTATEAEKQEIRNWLESSKENGKHLGELYDIWILTQMATAKENVSEKQEILQNIMASSGKASKLSGQEADKKGNIAGNIFVKIAYIAAAVIIAGLLIADIHVRQHQPKTIEQNRLTLAQVVDLGYMQELYVPKGAKSNIILPDSSTVKLNSDSKIIFPHKFTGDTREVYIEGEGYFDVKSDSLKPMIVNTATGYEIKVLGTKFNVYSYKNEPVSKTTLIEGRIDILSSNRVIAQLNDGDSFVKEEIKAIKKIADKNITNDIAWTKDMLVFNSTPMADVIKKLERWHGTRFIVKDPAIYSINLTAEYRNESLVQILEVIKFSAEIDYSIKGNIVTLSLAR